MPTAHSSISNTVLGISQSHPNPKEVPRADGSSFFLSIQNPYASDAQDFSLIHSVDEWLASIKMSRYSDNFRAAGVLDMDAVAKMSLQQLEADLGVTLVGHQKKMMNSIQALRAQLSVNMTEGFLV